MVKLLLMSDIHCNWGAFSPERIDPGNIDGILIAGDITNYGTNCSSSEWFQAYSWFESWRSYLGGQSTLSSHPIYWVGGNHDFGAYEFAQHSVHLATFVENKVVQTPWPACRQILGLNLVVSYDRPRLAQRWINTTANPDYEAYYYEGLPPVDIVLSHSPALDVLDTLPDGPALGSACLGRYVQETKPLLLVHGHVHEAAQAQPVLFGMTKVYNVAQRAVVIELGANEI